MGNQESFPERDVYELMKALLKKHGKKTLSEQDLKLILKWVQVKIPAVTASSIFTRELWDDVGVKLWDAATSGDEEAQYMLPSWRKIFETIKAQEQNQRGSEEGAQSPPPCPSKIAGGAEPSAPPLACAAGYPLEGDPLTRVRLTLKRNLIFFPLILMRFGERLGAKR